MKKILSHVRSACNKYNMIQSNDRIAVGVSGGKDSLVLLAALAKMRNFSDIPFDVVAVTADPCFNGIDCDYSAIEQLCKSLGVEYLIKRTRLWDVVFNERAEKNPCSLCSKMRRGILHNLCIEAGCNKIALGHHLDDAVETFFINLLMGARVGCFSPVSYLSNKNLYLIRPLVLTFESDVAAAAERNSLPVIKSLCPADKCSVRHEMKEQIRQLEALYPALRKKIITAMQAGSIDGWGI